MSSGWFGRSGVDLLIFVTRYIVVFVDSYLECVRVLIEKSVSKK